MILKVGDKVRYTDGQTGGSFEATVHRLIYAEGTETITGAMLMPKSPDLRAFLGRLGDQDAGAYRLGIAHWDKRLTLI